MSFVAIVVSVISASYYLKIIRVLHSENISDITKKNNNKNLNHFFTQNKQNTSNTDISYSQVEVMSNFHSLLISILTLSILLFIIKPSILLNITQLLSLSLYST